MKKILLPFVMAFVLLSCQNKTEIENQVTTDLVGMLHNKAEVNKLSIKQVSKTDSQTQTVFFDCNLTFIDDLYKEDGTLAFSKGMKVRERNNLFVYKQDRGKLKLIKLEFGETETIILNRR